MLGIIITTIEPNWSILANILQSYERIPNSKIYLVHQGNEDMKLLGYNNLEIIRIDYEAGLSKARNIGVQKAKEDGCDHVLLGAASISVLAPKKIEKYLNKMTTENFDLVGLGLVDRVDWEGELNLITGKCFELKIFHKKPEEDFTKIQPADIVRNFFIAKTDLLNTIKWDESLRMREHEDFFWRLKMAEAKVGFVRDWIGQYIERRTTAYRILRAKRMAEGLEVLKKKYGLENWIIYK